MDFKLRQSIFPQTQEEIKEMMGERYDPTKNYPQYSGTLEVPMDQVQSLIQYLSQCTPNHNDYFKDDFVPIRCGAYMNEMKSGKKFLTIQLRPMWEKKLEIEAKQGGGTPQPKPAPTAPKAVPPEKSEWF